MQRNHETSPGGRQPLFHELPGETGLFGGSSSITCRYTRLDKGDPMQEMLIRKKLPLDASKRIFKEKNKLFIQECPNQLSLKILASEAFAESSLLPTQL